MPLLRALFWPRFDRYLLIRVVLLIAVIVGVLLWALGTSPTVLELMPLAGIVILLVGILVFDLKSRMRSNDSRHAAQQSRQVPGSGSISEEIERLAALHASGALDDGEFQAAKRQLLSG